MKTIFKKTLSLTACCAGLNQLSYAQGGTTGIDAASSALTGYIDPMTTLILVIGAVVGLIGGVRVFVKWNSGDQDINKELMGWGGSCLFLVLVSVVIKGFFAV